MTDFIAIEHPDADANRCITEATLPDVRRWLAEGCRVLLLVRHAERPRIDFEDTSFGESLPLTAAGEKMSVDFGRLLAGASDDVQFRASPLRRTVMTAERIAEGMGVGSVDITEDARIGNGSAFVASERQVWELFRDGSFFARMDEWLRQGRQYGFNDLAPACDAFEEYALSTFTGRLGIYTSHDVYLVAYLHGRGVKTDFRKENWPCFLDAAAIILAPGGDRRYAFVRAGLSDKCCGV
ncbi:MAG: histidine phosphatase family protein [Kiritimatiellia bacterium]